MLLVNINVTKMIVWFGSICSIMLFCLYTILIIAYEGGLLMKVAILTMFNGLSTTYSNIGNLDHYELLDLRQERHLGLYLNF